MTANRISARFAQLREDGRKAFVAYICAGDPDLDTTVELVCALAEAGVDIVELGIPYSIRWRWSNQPGSLRARPGQRYLSAGVLDAVRQIRTRSEVPLLFFTYLNPIAAYGLPEFARRSCRGGRWCVAAGSPRGGGSADPHQPARSGVGHSAWSRPTRCQS